MKSNLKEYLGDKNFYSTILKIAIPVSGNQLITVGINLWIPFAQQHGGAQQSASSQAIIFINLFQDLLYGDRHRRIGIDRTFLGMQDKNSLRKAVTIMMRLCSSYSNANHNSVFQIFP